ncbi:MAG: hypothetical protein U0800_27595 [Isosphaeraceae bacterium]
MKPRTEAQRQAARINGSKSRGPVTDEGKEISSGNAVKHGLRSEKILPEAERPVYRGRRDAYVEAESEPPGPRRLNLLEALAMATVQVEIACSIRNASAERRAKQIVEQDQAELFGLFEAALARYRSGPSIEAFEELSRTPAGCEFISRQWAEIGRDISQVSDAQPLPIELRDRLLAATASINDGPGRIRAMEAIGEWERSPKLPKHAIIGLCHQWMTYWDRLADHCDEELRKKQELRLIEAQADTSDEGARQHRYMQSAIHTVLQLNKTLDAEHDREWRRRWKEARDDRREVASSEVVEARAAHSKKRASLPNEPGASQVLEEETVAMASGGIPSSAWASESPEGLAVSIEPQGLSHAHKDEGMPPGALSPLLPNEPGASQVFYRIAIASGRAISADS